MASIEPAEGGSHKKGPGVKKAKKLSTRIDMTPMVDLGFLLITFFIFTTTMNTPTTMDLFMPKDTENEQEQNKAKESGALTIMMGKDNTVFYYEGQLKVDETGNNFKSSTFKEIRKVILDKKKAVIADHRHDDKCEEIRQNWKKRFPADPDWEKACLDRDLVVVIKPNEEATFKNTVDMLDEMTINQVKRFAMVDISEVENELVKKSTGGQ